MSIKSFGMEGALPQESFSVTPGSELSFAQALREATQLAMREDPNVVIFGEGITDIGAVFGSTAGLLEEFGPQRVVETPLSENAITGICTGAALAGLRPIMVHQRVDFTLLGLDQLINHAAKWRYMYAGKLKVPFVMRCIVGKGWGQAAQHSQSLQALFAHFPGLRVVMPSSPKDAKGLLLAAIEDDNPVVFIEGRPLYNQKANVPSAHFTENLSKAVIRKSGEDLTILATSYLVPEAEKVAKSLAEEINIEVIDIRSISPLDKSTIVASVRKTKRALILDTSWRSYGMSAEVAATIYEECFAELKAPIARLTLPDVPTPCSPELEKAYYPDSNKIIQEVRRISKTISN